MTWGEESHCGAHVLWGSEPNMRAVADQKAAEVLMVALLKGALQRAGQLSFVWRWECSVSPLQHGCC